MFGPSGTRSFGPSGTGNSVHQEPESLASPRNCSAFRALNNPNREPFGFLLTPGSLSTGETRIAPAAPRRDAGGDPPLTHVTLTWHRGIREDWLRFGRPVAERIIDRRTRVESYAPGQVFALVRWASNDYGTRRSALAIVRAVGHGEAFSTLPQVDPGGEILLSLRGWPKVRTAFGLIDAIEQAGFDPCDIAPDHWRHMHNRLTAGMPPRAYDRHRHKAWLQRRRLPS